MSKYTYDLMARIEINGESDEEVERVFLNMKKNYEQYGEGKLLLERGFYLTNNETGNTEHRVWTYALDPDWTLNETNRLSE